MINVVEVIRVQQVLVVLLRVCLLLAGLLLYLVLDLQGELVVAEGYRVVLS